MKFNKWTVGLAAVGLVSLTSAAKAEEKPNMVETALSSTSLSGYVDTSAQWNFGTGNANMPAYRFGGPEKADGFNLNVVQLRLERPLDESEWAAGYRADFWFGPDANTLGTQSWGNSGDMALRQAYVALRMPVFNGIDWKVGVFDSIIGYESVESPNNPNYTRSYGHTLEPTTHTGVLATYRFSELVSVAAGIANTVAPQINSRAHSVYDNAYLGGDHAESYKTYMGSVAITAPESLGWLAGSTLYAGAVNGFNNNLDDEDADDYGEVQSNYYLGTTLATPVAGLRMGAAFDLLNWDNSGETWALAGYASYQATEKMSLHARADYLRDRGDQKYLPMNSDKVLALTGTVQYDLWKNLISRLELRWDHALDSVETFGADSDDDADLKNSWMLAANLIYKF